MIHFDPSAVPGGDGSREAPLGDAFNRVSALDRPVVVMAAGGTYQLIEEVSTLSRAGFQLGALGSGATIEVDQPGATRVIGACPTRTLVTLGETSRRDYALENLRVRSGTITIGGRLAIRRSVVEATTWIGSGAPPVGELRLEHCRVVGLLTPLELSRVELEDVAVDQPLSFNGVDAWLTRVRLRGDQGTLSALPALTVDEASLTADAVVAESAPLGIRLRDGAALRLQDAVVRRGSLAATSVAGPAVEVLAGTSLRASRLLVEGSDGVGVEVERHAILQLEDAIIRRPARDADARWAGLGLVAAASGRLELDGYAFLDAPFGAMRIDGSTGGQPTEIALRRGRVVGPASPLPCARAVEVGRGNVTGSIADLVIEGTYAIGVALFAGTAGETLAMADLSVVAGPAETPCEDPGIGLVVAGSASVALDGFLLHGASDCGYAVLDDARLRLTDGDVVGRQFGGCFTEGGLDVDLLRGPTVRYVGHERDLELWRDGPIPAPRRGR